MSIIVLGGDLESKSGQIVYGKNEVATFIGRTALTAAHNYATDVDNAFNITGSPTYNIGFVATSGSNFVDLGVPDASAMTLIAVVKPVSLAGEIISNAGNSVSSAGVSMGSSSSGQLKIWCGNGSATQALYVDSVFTVGTWKLVACTVSASAVKAYDLTGNKSGSGTSTGRALNNTNMRIGSQVAGSQTGQNEILIATVINSALSKTEIDTIAAMMRNYAAKYSVTV